MGGRWWGPSADRFRRLEELWPRVWKGTAVTSDGLGGFRPGPGWAGGPPGPEWVLCFAFPSGFSFRGLIRGLRSRWSRPPESPQETGNRSQPCFPAISAGVGRWHRAGSGAASPACPPETQGLSAQVCIAWKASLHVWPGLPGQIARRPGEGTRWGLTCLVQTLSAVRSVLETRAQNAGRKDLG